MIEYIYFPKVPKAIVQRLMDPNDPASQSFTEEQRRAAQLMLLSGPAKTVNFIVGGPLTGKTWSVALALKLFLENLTPRSVRIQ
jgi:hypothetical protein